MEDIELSHGVFNGSRYDSNDPFVLSDSVNHDGRRARFALLLLVMLPVVLRCSAVNC